MDQPPEPTPSPTPPKQPPLSKRAKQYSPLISFGLMTLGVAAATILSQRPSFLPGLARTPQPTTPSGNRAIPSIQPPSQSEPSSTQMSLPQFAAKPGDFVPVTIESNVTDLNLKRIQGAVLSPDLPLIGNYKGSSKPMDGPLDTQPFDISCSYSSESCSDNPISGYSGLYYWQQADYPGAEYYLRPLGKRVTFWWQIPTGATHGTEYNFLFADDPTGANPLQTWDANGNPRYDITYINGKVTVDTTLPLCHPPVLSREPKLINPTSSTLNSIQTDFPANGLRIMVFGKKYDDHPDNNNGYHNTTVSKLLGELTDGVFTTTGPVTNCQDCTIAISITGTGSNVTVPGNSIITMNINGETIHMPVSIKKGQDFVLSSTKMITFYLGLDQTSWGANHATDQIPTTVTDMNLDEALQATVYYDPKFSLTHLWADRWSSTCDVVSDIPNPTPTTIVPSPTQPGPSPTLPGWIGPPVSPPGGGRGTQ